MSASEMPETGAPTAAPKTFKPPKLRTMRVKGHAYAVVKFKGRRHLLGRSDDPEHLVRYERFVAHVRKHGTAPTAAELRDESQSYLVRELVADALDHFADYYRSPDGAHGGEYGNMCAALKPVVELFGELPAEKFGPLALQRVRRSLLDTGRFCRKEINARIHRIRRAFRWAATEERIPGSVVHGLETVDGLKAGRCNARESKPVLPVPYEVVKATIPYLPPTVATMVKLQALTGARPGEVCSLRMRHLNRTGPVWVATLDEHKNAWRGHSRTIFLEHSAQTLIKPYLQQDPEAFLFSPDRSERERHARQRQQRATRVQPSQERRASAARQRQRRRAPRDHYDTVSYLQAIRRACAAASAPGRRAAILTALPPDFRPLLESAIRRLPIALTPQRLEHAIRRVAARHRFDALPVVHVAAEALRTYQDSVPTWAPNQLRHSAATVAREYFGLDGSQALLGHKKADTTQLYAELEQRRGVQVAKDVSPEIARRLQIAQ